ncbi:MAG: DUF1761 domain-containing protein [Sphingobacteriaceae bacterium]|nr:DUF1761 domain-containing protein [Sphingobacteriaceae bacterium]
MKFHFYIPFVAAVTPLILGFIWYNPKVFGKAWMSAASITEDKMKGANMALIFGLTYLFSLFIAFAMITLTIHQVHIFSLFANEASANDPNSETGLFIQSIFEKTGTNFRTFKHGAFHGIIGGIMIALPIIGVNALFERKNFKYIAINAGFWIACMAIMGGLVSGLM